MSAFTKTFLKIIPSIRESNHEAIQSRPITGEKILISADGHTVPVYLHRAGRPDRPVVFELHGGGFVLGEAAKDDALCEKLKDGAGVNVVGIDYRLAPEFPYPAALEDVMKVLQHFGVHGREYGMDPEKFFLLGFSAGANLAAAASMKSKGKEEYKILSQMLHYPFLDATEDPCLKERSPSDLPAEVMEAFNDLYAPEGDRTSPCVSPLLADLSQLTGMPDTLILTAAEDVLRNQGETYAKRLRKAGVAVEYKSVEHAHHGYIEDYYNQACYDLNADDVKAAHDPRFGEAAGLAMEIVEKTIERYTE